MARQIQEGEPDTLIAGDTWRWRKTLGDYPPSEGWVLSYAIRGASVIPPAAVVVVAAAGYYDVSVAASATALLAVGTYRWAAIATAGAEVVTADSGVFAVERNLQTAAAGEATTHAERMVSLIEAALESRIPSGMASYQIAGRAVTSYTPTELRQLRAHYRREVWRQRNQHAAAQTVKLTLARTT